jgi:hypothetical protein
MASHNFPEDQVIKHWGVVSYAGVPLVNAQGICVGYLAVFYDRPMIKDRLGTNLQRIRLASRC